MIDEKVYSDPRLLVIDDNRDIHSDIKKIFFYKENNILLDDLEADLFGVSAQESENTLSFSIDSAYQGEEGLHLLRKSLQQGRPYAIAVVDMRMPPGWDGIETIQHLWAEDPKLDVIICTAYSDHSWADILTKLDPGDRLLILKKPFDNIEIRQMTHALVQKRLLQEALKRANASRYRLLYDDNPAMFFTLSADHTIVSANRFGAAQLGYDVTTIVGMPAQALYEASEWQKVKSRLDECFNNPDSVRQWETSRRCQDGSMLWVRETARVIIDPEKGASLLLVCEDISDSRLLYEKLVHEASHDGLTELHNRRAFEHELTQLLKAKSGSHVVCYIDLDQFKIINDTCGHLAGDELLRQVARLLKKNVRRQDMIARLGGDEFGILFQDCPLEFARSRVANVHNAIGTYRFKWEDKTFTIGASIGLVPFEAGCNNLAEILGAVDSACYVAKNEGRNRIYVAAVDDPKISRHHYEVSWVNRINNALNNNRFRLDYQIILPINPLQRSGVHFELLVRMIGEDNLPISPESFLPCVERYDLSCRLDGWVFETALRWLSDHPEAAASLRLCSINLSSRSIVQENFVDHLYEELKQRKQIARTICFEITETAAITNLAAATEFALRMHEIGCSVALDDFGSGASSFSYLKALPIDFLKIDGMFVKGLMENAVDRAIVRSIHEVGSVMGKRTIAEFVENQAILNELKTIGIHYAQGFYIGCPAPLKTFKPPSC